MIATVATSTIMKVNIFGRDINNDGNDRNNRTNTNKVRKLPLQIPHHTRTEQKTSNARLLTTKPICSVEAFQNGRRICPYESSSSKVVTCAKSI